MQGFDEFLEENYEMTLAEYERLGEYMKRCIDAEYDEHVAHFVGRCGNGRVPMDGFDWGEFTIRDCDTGAVVCTGFTALDEEMAVGLFYQKNPDYDGDVYAAVSGWND